MNLTRKIAPIAAALGLTLAGLTATAAPAHALTCYSGTWEVANVTPGSTAYFAMTYQYGTGVYGYNCMYHYDAYMYPAYGPNWDIRNVGAIYIGTGWCAWVRDHYASNKYAAITGNGQWFTQAQSPHGAVAVDVTLGRHWTAGFTNCW